MCCNVVLQRLNNEFFTAKRTRQRENAEHKCDDGVADAREPVAQQRALVWRGNRRDRVHPVLVAAGKQHVRPRVFLVRRALGAVREQLRQHADGLAAHAVANQVHFLQLAADDVAPRREQTVEL